MFSIGFPGLGIMGTMFSMYLIGYILGRRGRRPPTEGEIIEASSLRVGDYLESSYEAGLARGLEEGYSKFNKTLVKAKSDAWDEGFNAGYEEATEDN